VALALGRGAGAVVLQFALSIVVAGVLLATPRARRASSTALRSGSHRRPAGTCASSPSRRCAASRRAWSASRIIQCVLTAIALFTIGFPALRSSRSCVLLDGDRAAPARDSRAPMIIYVWANEPALSAVLFTAWMVPVTLLDNI
jgi:hypothetical protein